MEATHVRRQAQDGSVEAEVTRLEARIAALDTVKTDFASLRSSLPEGG